MKIKIPVIWEMCGMVEIEADSLEEAIEGFHSAEDDLPLPECSDYVDGSFAISTDDLNTIRLYNPEAPAEHTEGEDIACVDSALLLYDDWQETARELWQAPEEICSKLTGDNIVLDSLVDLQSKHSDVKILFTCSVRDHDLQRYQAYIRDGSMESNPENSALFQQDLNAFVIQMQKDLSNPGFYIWEYGQQPDGSTQHMIWPSNPFDRLSDDVTAAEWLDRAVQGEILSCGLDLLQ